MRSRSKASLGVAAGLLFFVVGASPALAADTTNSEYVIIPTDDVFADDLYAGAVSVTVDGTIEGDLIAFAGEEVVINGTVTGSVFAVSPRVEINGQVGGSVRASGSSIEIAGVVERDVVAAVWSARLSPGSSVDGDVIFWARKVEALGFVGADLTGSMHSLDLGGELDGDLDVSVGSLEIVDTLIVGGDLGYRSADEAQGLDMASVEGAVVHKSPLPPNLRVRALGLLGRFLVVLFLSVAGLAVAYGWPDRTASAVERVGAEPAKSWGIGALVFLAPVAVVLVSALILGIAPAAAAYPLLAILVPVALALFGIVFALSLVAGVPAVGWVGGVFFKRLDLYGSILAGGVLAGVAWHVPWLGFLVPLLVLPLGLGAWLRGKSQTATGSL